MASVAPHPVTPSTHTPTTTKRTPSPTSARGRVGVRADESTSRLGETWAGMARSPSPSSASGSSGTPRSARGTPRSASAPRSSRSATPSGSLSSRGSILLHERPAWDGTPLRARPPALRGLLAHQRGGRSPDGWGSEPWARDETVYNQRFGMWSDYDGHFNIGERFEYSPVRVRMLEMRKTDYIGRWNNKFEQIAGKIDRFDGNPFT